jgi:hypothetical protein
MATGVMYKYTGAFTDPKYVRSTPFPSPGNWANSAPRFLQGATAGGFPNWPSFTFGEGALAVPYSQDFDLYPANSPTTYTLVSGALPNGLALSNVGSDIGSISGTPTAVGTFSFTLRATNAFGTADKAFSITIIQIASGSSYAFSM